MSRCCFSLLLLVLISHQAEAQHDMPPYPPPPDLQGCPPVEESPQSLSPQELLDTHQARPECLVSPVEGFVLTNRVLFVFDVSGSMKDPGKIPEAIAGCMLILGSGVDDFRVGVITFDDSYRRWEGVPECCGHTQTEPCGEKCVPVGWAAMPESYELTVRWVAGLTASPGNTEPGPALEAACKDPSTFLTVVLVTDGAFTHSKTDPAQSLERGQSWRRDHGLPEAQVMIWGAGTVARNSKGLKKLSQQAGGGMWVQGQARSGPW